MSERQTDTPSPQVRRLARLVRLSLAMNGLLLLVNGAMAYVVFAIVLAEPAEVAGVTDFTEPGSGADVDDEAEYQEEMRDFMERMTDLLDRQARKAGVNPADVLPTQQEIDDAVETRTMHSDESQVVLQKLREGFDYFDMTWPIAIPER